MPGNVATASPSTTMPVTLSRAFTRVRTHPAVIADYKDGSSQRKAQTDHDRLRWRLSKRLTPGQMDELRAFYEARNGPLEPFYFYDPAETSPKFTLTPSGTQGRYAVRFDCPWSQSMGIARGDVDLEIVEIY